MHYFRIAKLKIKGIFTKLRIKRAANKTDKTFKESQEKLDNLPPL